MQITRIALQQIAVSLGGSRFTIRDIATKQRIEKG